MVLLPCMLSGQEALKPREAQFVFVIDDSRSMGGLETDRTDPDRLAVFAVRALLAVLDNRDWATVIRLNGASAGESATPLGLLSQDQRTVLYQDLALENKLASYSGDNTPCRSALREAAEILDRADSRHVSQTVIFLTDGRCSPQDAGEHRILDVFKNLQSYRDKDRFHFYVLQFQQSEGSPELGRLADQSEGAILEVLRGNPSRILYSFAKALAQSQGFEAHILAPTSASLPAHRGSNRIRLLAVAVGAGEPLELQISGAQSLSPVTTRELDRGRHQYDSDRQIYRYVSVEYDPIAEPVNVQVLNAGGDWEVVALPEYRLRLDFTLHSGSCAQQGLSFEHDVVPAGSDLCAAISLVNTEGQVVGRDVTRGRLEAFLEIERPGQQALGAIPANPIGNSEASFQLDLAGLVAGHHQIRAALQLVAPGEDAPRRLLAPIRTIQAVDRRIRIKPDQLDLGTIVQGKQQFQTVELEGTFREAAAIVNLGDPNAIPECVALTFGGQPFGARLKVSPGLPYQVEAKVGNHCPKNVVEPINIQLHLSLPDLLPGKIVRIPVTFQLDTRTLDLEAVAFELKAGAGFRSGFLTSSNEAPLETFSATIEPLKGLEGQAVDSLQLEVLGKADQPIRPGKKNLGGLVDLAAGKPIEIRVGAGPCCAAGTFDSRLILRPTNGGPTVRQPIKVTVQGDWWSCYRSWILAGLVGLLAGLLVFYVLNMFTQSRFLKVDPLAARLIPLRWPRHGGSPQPSRNRGNDYEDVQDVLRDSLVLHRRVLNWFKANPLIFGWPGNRYCETLELFLAPGREITMSAMLMPEPHISQRLRTADEMDAAEEGRLFAVAGDGATFQGVIGSTGQIGQLKIDGPSIKSPKPKLEPMRKRQRLIYRQGERREGAVAGWELD